MTVSLYLSSAQSKSGKTEIGVGIGLMLKEMGLSVSYYKPFGIRQGKEHQDPEVEILAKIFEQEPAELCCMFIDPLYYEEIDGVDREELKKKLYDEYARLAAKSDVVIIEGTKKVNQLITFDLDDASLAILFDNAPVLAVNPFTNDLDIADVVLQHDILTRKGARYIGVVLNRVPSIMVPRIEEPFKPMLAKRGIEVLGIVERDDRLTAPTFREIMKTLNGKLLDEDETGYDLDKLVGSILVGAMSAHSALSYFRKKAGTVIITGGDRADIVLTALETDLAGIVLTGNLYPDLRVVSAAKQKGVPLVLVPHDTFTAASKVNEVVAELQINERGLCKELVEKHVDIDRVRELIGA